MKDSTSGRFLNRGKCIVKQMRGQAGAWVPEGKLVLMNRQVWQVLPKCSFICDTYPVTQCSSSFFVASFPSPTQGNRAFLSVFLGTQVFIIQNRGLGQGVCLAIFLCSGRNSSLCMRSQELCCYGSGSSVFPSMLSL